MWTHDTFSLEGEYFQVREAELRLKPRNPTPPEMFMAANSERGRQMVAEVGDWWFLPYDRSIKTSDELLRELEKSIADMTVRMERLGRRVRFGFNPFVGFGPDPASAVESTIARIIQHERNPDTDKIRHSMLPATLAGCMGTPAQIRRQIGRFRDMGIELILFKMATSVDGVQQIGAEIIAPYRREQTTG
jgi:alkanesulfonate monooxygenase SsuD/methylene tetrahydromethanopterin reductase-like flavin-dependent oxidoreductase (luciferase family)